MSTFSRNDDTRQPLLKTWIQKFLSGPWLFRILMVAWKIYDSLDRD